ncbi:MAG TPA: biosynthetic peptidoglycan transglycosylase, partial [Anaeromyxobacteraceae bacterium]|nr:biosynthetic peptidoglycan transglycosylase [Anaeromyxobacteraceae bacterium]
MNRDATRAMLRDRIETSLRARIPGARVGPSLRVDTRFRLVFGPVSVPSRRRGGPPVVTIEEARVRPRWRALLSGRVEAASVALGGVVVETGRRGEALRDLADALSSRRGAGAAPTEEATEPPVLRFENVRVRGPVIGGATVELGPMSGDARMARDGERRTVAFRLQLPGRASVEGSAWREAGGTSLSARVEHLTSAVVPAALLRRAPVEIVGGAVSGELDAAGLGRGGGTVGWDLRAYGLVVASPRLAADAVGPVNAVSRGRAVVDVQAARVNVQEAEVRLGGDARAAATFSLDLRLRPRTFDLRVDAPALDWHALGEALPPQLAPGGDAPPVAGTFGVELHAEGPLHDPARWALDASVDLGGLGRERERIPLLGSFQHVAELSGGRSRSIVVGPQNPAFVAVATLPQHVVRAITTAEDASFWGHDGFDFHELQDAIAAGARRGQLGRGASTITQQVAKNLWLGRERTLARKAREALLTIALEASLPKQRILEIYLNVAEWGPGIVGLGEAARHYFDKDARDLGPKEAAFLASIIPNPVRYHVYCARGELSPAWEARVDDLLVRLWTTGVLSTAQLDAARAER